MDPALRTKLQGQRLFILDRVVTLQLRRLTIFFINKSFVTLSLCSTVLLRNVKIYAQHDTRKKMAVCAGIDNAFDQDQFLYTAQAYAFVLGCFAITVPSYAE
uniref:Uncharacterized protein n=1 Tax=Pararge aegeria TaxID=116150 RepID=S4NQR3_9NEOP